MPDSTTFVSSSAPNRSVDKGNTLSMIFVVLMYLIILGCVALGVKEIADNRGKKE